MPSYPELFFALSSLNAFFLVSRGLAIIINVRGARNKRMRRWWRRREGLTGCDQLNPLSGDWRLCQAGPRRGAVIIRLLSLPLSAQPGCGITASKINADVILAAAENGFAGGVIKRQAASLWPGRWRVFVRPVSHRWQRTQQSILAPVTRRRLPPSLPAGFNPRGRWTGSGRSSLSPCLHAQTLG